MKETEIPLLGVGKTQLLVVAFLEILLKTDNFFICRHAIKYVLSFLHCNDARMCE